MDRSPRLALTPLEDRVVPDARLQLIHNAPFASAAVVDLYLTYPTGATTTTQKLDDVPFRSASGYLTIPSAAAINVVVTVARGTSTGDGDTANRLLQTTLTLANNSNTVGVVVGDPSQSSGANRLQVVTLGTARTQAATAGNAEFVTMHGSPDAGVVDVKVRGVGTVANDLAYPLFNPTYQSVAPANYTVDVYQQDGVTQVGSFGLNLSNAPNRTYTVLASGLVNPPAGSTGSFGLLAVDNTGTGQFLAQVPTVGEQSYAAGATAATLFDVTNTKQFTVSPFASGIQARVAAADVTGDNRPDLIAGAGPGGTSKVIVYSGATQQIVAQFDAFEAGFTGGVYVAAADLNNDGFADVIVTPDQGGGPIVAIYDGAKLNAGQGAEAQLNRFFGIEDATFRGGARPAVGDVNGDQTMDVIISAGFGGGPRVAVFNGGQVLTPVAAGVPPKLRPDFFAFEQTLRNGVFVAGGDVTGDGKADVVLGGGPGGGPRVRVASGAKLLSTTFTSLDDAAAAAVQVGNFFAGPDANRDGVRVAVKDLDGDGQADVVVGLGSAGVAQVRTFRGRDVTASATPAAAFDADPFTSPGVVFVG